MAQKRRSKNNKLIEWEIQNEIQHEIEIYEKNKRVETQKATVISQNIRFLSDFSPKNERQKELLRAIHENHVIFVTGPAGAGKTIIALKGALECLSKKGSLIEQILVTKPIIEAAESLGHLPGSQEEKIEPYMHSFYANVKKLVGPVESKKLMDHNLIKSVPLAYMRGATFTSSIAILDEAQNTTKTGMKLFLSRIGENSKVIILGDIDQTDLKFRNGEKSGLQDAFERFQDLNGVAFVRFTEDDIVRNTILIEIMKRYKN